MLQIKNLSKQYAGLNVLRTVTLDLSAGETFGLIGLNGAGKTTIIKCVLDLQRADHGTITIADIPSLNELARKQLVYMPEKFVPPDYMNGWDYLAYINRAHTQPPLNKTDLKFKAHSLYDELELDIKSLQKSVRHYSKGMLQKLGLIGCMLSGKPLFILDEPMSGLDPKARVLFRAVIQRLKNEGKTILLCTHILNDIEALCDRVGILHQGQLLFSGTPQECCDQYSGSNLEQAFLNCLQQ
ncbi:MAG: ABC transporter ATP-binding protein [Gammaproteobacteria bacterium]|nr:ABC transporter ATP-binding protein [Gammaproteobacteria bacterium]